MEIPDVPSKNMVNNLSKWVPLICASAAFGISIIALKEIKNVRKELNLKKTDNPDLDKKFQTIDEQLIKITEYIKNNKQPSEIIKNAVKASSPKKNIKIINEPEPVVSDEFEEVEVTDSDEDE